MLALPTDRHRAFVRALYTVRPGHGARVKAAKIAGFGCDHSTPQTMATIAAGSIMTSACLPRLPRKIRNSFAAARRAPWVHFPD